jgi:diadenosine tetraphosphate (Ap4A) HIT family hydrolase
MSGAMNCELCGLAGGLPIWANEELRVIRVEDPSFPAFYRVIWNEHVAEFSDLPAAARHRCLDVVATVELTLRQQLAPTKVNLASLGNMTPHLHWHVIARFEWDSHFPQPIWASAQRDADVTRMQRLRASLTDLDRAVGAALADL